VGDSNYYYFNSQGYLVQNQWVDGKYFVSKEGVMLTNSWIPNPAGYPYYVDQNGAWVPGYQGQGESQDWLQRGIDTAEDRYWININGVRQYVKNAWQQIDGKWYYFDESGVMQIGWKTIGNNTYYFSASGAMVTGWQKIDGEWYYFGAGGAKVANTWIGNYYVDADGKWIPGYK